MQINAKEIGSRIKKSRKELGYTQETFSELLSISRVHLAKLECGMYAPSLELIVEIAALTGRSLDYHILGIKNNTLSAKDRILLAIELMNEVAQELEQ